VACVTSDVTVRTAGPDDAAAVGRVQFTTWREAYAGILPTEVLDVLDAEELATAWRTAAQRPPSPYHRLLVAAQDGAVVGFSAVGPAADTDLDPGRVGELYTLLVEPSAAGRGHGSRLLMASADHLREDGFSTAVTWLLAADERMRGFLTEAGWAPDGAYRGLVTGPEPAPTLQQVRLHTDLR
jgi:GNAT superfamily N-acetyltransferase